MLRAFCDFAFFAVNNSYATLIPGRRILRKDLGAVRGARRSVRLDRHSVDLERDDHVFFQRDHVLAGSPPRSQGIIDT